MRISLLLGLLGAVLVGGILAACGRDVEELPSDSGGGSSGYLGTGGLEPLGGGDSGLGGADWGLGGAIGFGGAGPLDPMDCDSVLTSLDGHDLHDDFVFVTSFWPDSVYGFGYQETLVLPLVSSGTYDFVVDWGDGEQNRITAFDDPHRAHKYASWEPRLVRIRGKLRGWGRELDWVDDSFSDVEPPPGMPMTVVQWGSLEFGNTIAQFYETDLTDCASDAPDLAGTKSLKKAFSGAVVSGDLSNWDVSEVTDLSSAFELALGDVDISKWDVSSVTDMSWTFAGSSTTSDLSNWDVSSVADMSGTFSTLKVLESGPHYPASDFTWYAGGERVVSKSAVGISAWNVSKVTKMVRTFRYSGKLDLDLSAWNVSSVTDMSHMFQKSEFGGNIATWDVSNVTNMEGMFASSSFNGDIADWDVSSVTNMKKMFGTDDEDWSGGWCKAPDFRGDISKWDVSNVTNMEGMFAGAGDCSQTYNPDVTAWNVSSVTNMSKIFAGNGAFDRSLASWALAKVTSAEYLMTASEEYPSTLSQENYDALLIAWATKSSTTSGSIAVTQQYSAAAAAARATLVTRGWSIQDGGLAP